MYDLEIYEEVAFYLLWGGWFFPLIAIMWGVFQLKDPRVVYNSNLWIIVVALYLVLVMSLSPGSSGDKKTYMGMFEYIFTNDALINEKDSTFYFFAYWIGKLTGGRVFLWFVFVASVYVGGVVFFCKKCFPLYAAPIFISSVIAFGFWNYGVNGLRTGFALSVLLIAVACYFRYKKTVLSIILALVSIGCHITMIIPISGFFLAHWVRKPKFFIVGWFLCLLLSLSVGSQIQLSFGRFFEDFEDTRIASYTLATEHSIYSVGFRWDFLLYSFIAIVIALYYKCRYRVQDRLYDVIFCTYLAANGFWLLLIRIPYSDRVAYLSWFLIPLLLMIPNLRWREISDRGSKIAITLFGQASFFIFMMFYRSHA